MKSEGMLAVNISEIDRQYLASPSFFYSSKIVTSLAFISFSFFQGDGELLVNHL